LFRNAPDVVLLFLASLNQEPIGKTQFINTLHLN